MKKSEAPTPGYRTYESSNIILQGVGGMQIDKKRKVAQIPLNKNAVYRVIDGKIEMVDIPGVGFGKQIITWQNGKPTHYEISYTKK